MGLKNTAFGLHAYRELEALSKLLAAEEYGLLSKVSKEVVGGGATLAFIARQGRVPVTNLYLAEQQLRSLRELRYLLTKNIKPTS